jgi:hypothetical protein
MWRRVVLSVVLGLAVVLLVAGGPASGQAATVSLTVQVGLRAPNGALSAAPSVSAPSPVSPVGGVEVRAVAAGGSADAPAASAVTDDEGTATLDLAPGVYWVFVVRADPPTSGPLGTTLSRALPDGTLSPAWEEVDLSDGSPSTVLLVATQLNP